MSPSPNKKQAPPNQRQRQALLSAIGLMCRIYRGPVGLQTPPPCTSADLEALAPLEPMLDTESAQVVARLRRMVRHHERQLPPKDHLDADYVSLFVNDRGGIVAPLYASCYVDADNPQLMAAPAIEMADRLRHAGLLLSAETQEPADHLAIMLEYLYFLLDCEKTVVETWPPEAARMFVRKSMLPWVSRLAQRLASAKKEDNFYSLATALLVALLETIAAG